MAGDGERPIVWRINQNFSNPVHYSRERGSTFERYYTDISRMSLALHQSGLNFFFCLHILWNILLVLLISTWMRPSGVGVRAGCFCEIFFPLLIASWVFVMRKMQRSRRKSSWRTWEIVAIAAAVLIVDFPHLHWWVFHDHPSRRLLQVWVKTRTSKCQANFSGWARQELGGVGKVIYSCIHFSCRWRANF